MSNRVCNTRLDLAGVYPARVHPLLHPGRYSVLHYWCAGRWREGPPATGGPRLGLPASPLSSHVRSRTGPRLDLVSTSVQIHPDTQPRVTPCMAHGAILDETRRGRDEARRYVPDQHHIRPEARGQRPRAKAGTHGPRTPVRGHGYPRTTVLGYFGWETSVPSDYRPRVPKSID